MVCFLTIVFGFFADVNPKVIETAADEAVGPMANVEYKRLVEKLGGTQKNQVFSFFEIVPPRREAKMLLAEAEERKQQKVAGGVGATIVLEKKKRRGREEETTRRRRQCEDVKAPDAARVPAERGSAPIQGRLRRRRGGRGAL